jgi:hypothetical protein
MALPAAAESSIWSSGPLRPNTREIPLLFTRLRPNVQKEMGLFHKEENARKLL